MSKYHSRKTRTADGIVHDSKKEANRWLELQLMERAGKIHTLRRQVKFVLVPAQYETYERYSNKTGRRLADGRRLVEREISYIADFVYVVNEKTVVEDVKGLRTDVYVIKRKLMRDIYGIQIKEV